MLAFQFAYDVDNQFGDPSGIELGFSLEFVKKLEELCVGHSEYGDSMDQFGVDVVEDGNNVCMRQESAMSIAKGLRHVPNLRKLELPCWFLY